MPSSPRMRDVHSKMANVSRVPDSGAVAHVGVTTARGDCRERRPDAAVPCLIEQLHDARVAAGSEGSVASVRLEGGWISEEALVRRWPGGGAPRKDLVAARTWGAYKAARKRWTSGTAKAWTSLLAHKRRQRHTSTCRSSRASAGVLIERCHGEAAV